MQDTQFNIKGNRLVVTGELGPEDEKAYSEALFTLLKSGFDEMEIDFRGLHEMSSAYIGSTCLLTLVANQRKRKLSILASREIARVLEMSGLDKLTTVRVREE